MTNISPQQLGKPSKALPKNVRDAFYQLINAVNDAFMRISKASINASYIRDMQLHILKMQEMLGLDIPIPESFKIYCKNIDINRIKIDINNKTNNLKRLIE